MDSDCWCEYPLEVTSISELRLVDAVLLATMILVLLALVLNASLMLYGQPPSPPFTRRSPKPRNPESFPLISNGPFSSTVFPEVLVDVALKLYPDFANVLNSYDRNLLSLYFTRASIELWWCEAKGGRV